MPILPPLKYGTAFYFVLFLTNYRMKQFWLPALCYSISNGVFFSWQSQLVVIFKDAQGVGQVRIVHRYMEREISCRHHFGFPLWEEILV